LQIMFSHRFLCLSPLSSTSQSCLQNHLRPPATMHSFNMAQPF
jgi:hypothetical protein